MKKLCVVLALLLALLCVTPCFAENTPAISSPSALLVDLDSGEPVFRKGEDATYTMGSLSKVMTAILVLEKCTDLSVQVTVSEKAYKYTSDATPNAYLKTGETYSLDELLSLLMVRSGTDVAAVLAEHIAGGWDAYVALANKKAQDIGCTNTNFKNASGRETPQQYTSAHDMMLMLQEAMKDPRFMGYAVKKAYGKFNTSNAILLSNKTDYYYDAASGVAYAQLDDNENHIATVLNKGGKQYACVVMGGQVSNNLKQCFLDVKVLGEWVVTAFKSITLAKAGTIMGDVPLLFCEKTDRANLVLANDVKITVPSDTAESRIVATLQAEELKAPLSAGQTVGKMIYTLNGETLAEEDLILQMDYPFSEKLERQYRAEQFRKTPAYTLIVLGVVFAVLIGLLVAGYFLLKRNGHTYRDVIRCLSNIVKKLKKK